MGAVLLIAATRRRSAVSSEETVGALDEVVASTGGAAQCSDSIQQLAIYELTVRNTKQQ